MTKAFDARQDLIGRLGPPERLRTFIRDVDVATDGRLQFSGATEDAAPKLFLGEGGEPALHEVHPGAAGGREVDMEPGMPHQPAVNHRGLMRTGVVDDEVDVQLRRDRGVNRHQEPVKFSGAVALMELADDFAALGIQRGEERGRPMPRVVVGPALDLPRPHWQHGLRAIQRLDLGFFVDAQPQRFVGRIEVEPDDVADFVDEQRIFGQLERLAPMRLQSERAPDAAHRGLTESAALRHGARTPVRGVPRRAFQGQSDHPLDLCVRDLARRSRTRLIQQPRQPLPDEAMPPAPHRLPRDAGRGRDLPVGLGRGARQDEARALGQALRRGRTTRPLFQRLPFVGGQHDGRCWTTCTHRCPPCLHEERRCAPVCSAIFNSGH